MEHIERLTHNKTYWPAVIGLVFSTLTHLFFLVLFYSYSVQPLFLFNVFSVILFAVLVYMVIKKNCTTLAMIIACTELIIHQILAVIYLGWDYGFQYYLLAVPAVILLGTFKQYYLPIFFTVTAVFSLTLLNIFSLNFEPIYELTDIKEQLYLCNLILFTITIAMFTGFFGFTSHRNEELLVEAQEELYAATTIDPLTGLVNRSKALEEMESLRQNSLGSQENYVLAIVDIDNFKEINDQHGHDIGDIVLINIADLIEQYLRPFDLVGRWGGEEFLILLPKTSLEAGVKLLDNMRGRIANSPIEFDDLEMNITVTIGAVESSGKTNEILLKEADHALHLGKNTTKNCVTSDLDQIDQQVLFE